MQNSHDKFIYQKNPFYSSVTCRLALCKKCLKLNWFEGVLYAKSNEGWSRKNQILTRNSKKQKCRNLFPHWTENNSPYHSAASEGCTVSLLHRVFQCVFTNTEPSDEREGRSTQGWESSRWMHERLITFLPVEPRLSTKEEPEVAKLETRAFQIIQNPRLVRQGSFLVTMHTAALPQISSIFFFLYLPPCQLNVLSRAEKSRSKHRGEGTVFPSRMSVCSGCV